MAKGSRRPAYVPGIRTDRRCGWPPCKKGAPDDWHTSAPGERRPWGFHDVQCPTQATDPDLLPDCTLIAGHAPPCDYRPVWLEHLGGKKP
jgi:hypothetical protein